MRLQHLIVCCLQRLLSPAGAQCVARCTSKLLVLPDVDATLFRSSLQLQPRVDGRLTFHASQSCEHTVDTLQLSFVHFGPLMLWQLLLLSHELLHTKCLPPAEPYSSLRFEQWCFLSASVTLLGILLPPDVAGVIA